MYECDAAIITAVEVETNSVMRLYKNWKKIDTVDTAQDYYETTFRNGGRERRLINAQQSEMGMTAAATLTTKIVSLFKPKYVIMVGIAAGIGEKQMYGDVIVPDVIWNYSCGKFVDPESAPINLGSIGFQPRPSFIETDSRVIEIVKKLVGSPDNDYHIQIGSLACGHSVVANSMLVDKQIKSHMPHTVGLDMESYSVAYAVKHSPFPATAIVIKSICDYANGEKSDEYQKFAAYTSSGFAKLLIQNYLEF